MCRIFLSASPELTKGSARPALQAGLCPGQCVFWQATLQYCTIWQPPQRDSAFGMLQAEQHEGEGGIPRRAKGGGGRRGG